MIVSDNNALNSYLKTPPYFGGERGVNSVFEITPPRQVPSVIQDRGTEQESRWAEERRQARKDHPLHRSDSQDSRGSQSSPGRQAIVYTALPELRLAKPWQREVDSRLSSQAQIRTQLAHSGYLPRQLVVAGGHAFDISAQARATLNASKVHQQRLAVSPRNTSKHVSPK